MDGTVSFRRKGERNIQHPAALPVFSVDTEEDAEALQVLTCSMAQDGTGRYGWPGFYDASLDGDEQLAKMIDVAERMDKYYALIQSNREL